MERADLLILLALVLVPPTLTAYLLLRIAARYWKTGWVATHQRATYLIGFGIWLGLLALVLAMSYSSQPSPESPAMIEPVSPSQPSTAAPASPIEPSTPSTQKPPRGSTSQARPPAEQPSAPAAPPIGEPPPAQVEPSQPSSPTIRDFPWPPPAPSGSLSIPLTRILQTYSPRSLFGEVDDALRRALNDAGHLEASYYSVPGGYALATHIESIADDGSPKPGRLRWDVTARTNEVFSLVSYISALFTAPTGRYRVIVFVVTAAPFVTDDAGVTREEATAWLRRGSNMLPSVIYYTQVPDRTSCTALIYEFEKAGDTVPAQLNRPGAIAVLAHIAGTGLRRLLP